MMTDVNPPPAAERIVTWFVPAGAVGASIVGDLREEHAERVRAGDRTAADRAYRRQVLSIVLHFLGEPWRRRRRQSKGASSGRHHGPGPWLGELGLSIRALARRPLYAAAIVSTLALGIGGSTLIFSIADSALFKPLPFSEPDRLVGIYFLDANRTDPQPATRDIVRSFAVPYAVYRDWEAGGSVFESIGAYALTSVTIRTGNTSTRAYGARVTSGVFEALRVAPLVGTPLTPRDDQIGAPGRVLIGHDFWQRQFGGNRTIVGQSLDVDGTPHTIAGVMPQGFGFPDGEERVWLTFDDESRARTERTGGFLQVLARLEPGVSLEQAQRRLDALMVGLAAVHPEDKGAAVRVVPRADVVGGEVRPGLVLLLAAAATLLLAVCANIANLVLVRATERRRDIGVRHALGAGRGRLLWHVISECLVLSLAGGLAGLALASVAMPPLVAALPPGMPRAAEMTIDHRVLLFTVALSSLVGLLIGLLPALRASGRSVVDALRDAGRGCAGTAHGHRAQSALVVSQITCAFVLLAVTGLLAKSYWRMTTTSFGFEPDRLLTLEVGLPDAYQGSPHAMRGFFEELTRRLQAVPGIESVATASQIPFGGLSFPPTSVRTAGGVQDRNLHSGWASPAYFGVMGIPILTGRGFTSQDRPDATPVAIVNRTLAQTFWPGQNPIGQQVRVNIPVEGQSRWLTVVGVVGDIRYSPQVAPFPEIYLPYAQSPVHYQTVVMRTSLAPEAILPAVRHVTNSLDRGIPVEVSSLDTRRDRALAASRFRITVFVAIAALAGLLSAIGIYGILAYGVTQRTRELAVRLALGAPGVSVVSAVMRHGLLLAAIGTGAGAAASFAVSGLIGSILFEVSPTDAGTLGAVALLVLTVSSLASYLPARRTTRVSVTQALRSE